MSTGRTMIFISYRRKESVLHTLLLYERLQRQFAGQVFMDQQELEPGENFRVKIESQLQGCRAMLAVIGPNWSKAKDLHGLTRLHNSNDWVRLEVSTALKRGIKVIPVLIDGAQMPEYSDIPLDLHPLLDVQALNLDHERYFEESVSKLALALNKILNSPNHVNNNRKKENVEILKIVSEKNYTNKIDWAVSQGVDKYGEWADLDCYGVVQKMRWIKPGTFRMGCDSLDVDGYSDEKPQLPVKILNGFWMADTACTQDLWLSVAGGNPSFFCNDLSNPVENVSWDDINEIFLPAINKNLKSIVAGLPTEAEWEYSCRAGTQTPYFFGEKFLDSQINSGNIIKKTIPVKSLPPNKWGLYQMHGNVSEWCLNIKNKYGEIDRIGEFPSSDNLGRVFRGGSWGGNSKWARSAYRGVGNKNTKSSYCGFRFCLHDI